mgnify:FL=1
MTITEAAREAEKTSGCISRKAWRDLRFAILPTDSTDCCIPIALDKAKGKTPMRIRWEPQSDDLIADDWYTIIPEELPKDIRNFVISKLEEIDKRREALRKWCEEHEENGG